MRLVRFLEDGTAKTGTVDPEGVVRGYQADPETPVADTRERHLSELSLLPVVTRSAAIVCVGLNYVDHAEEAGAALPGEPLLFGKSPNSLLAHGAPILLPTETTSEVDYEAELGVVIGRRCTGVAEREALDYVGGYTCVNDVSARDLQFAHGQWYRGKSLDTFCPVGPFIVTPDEVPDPQALGIRAYVNGDLRQDSSTANMVFGVAELISYISRTITLEPGDLIATGTPAGVGYARHPKALLAPGDVITVEIDGVGSLVSPVAEKRSWTR